MARPADERQAAADLASVLRRADDASAGRTQGPADVPPVPAPQAVAAQESARTSADDPRESALAPGAQGGRPAYRQSDGRTSQVLARPRRTLTERMIDVVPVLMYHYVRVVDDPSDVVGIGLSVTPTALDAQLGYLREAGYTPIAMRDLQAAAAGAGRLPAKPIVLTFDDGYRDFFTAAWPLLQRHRCRATAYIITGLVGADAYMDRSMLRELDATGSVELGSHTVSHVDLPSLPLPRLQREVLDSRRQLEDWLQHPIDGFCYPAGRYHAGVVEAVRAAGYTAATTTRPGVGRGPAGSLEWRRVRVAGPGSVANLRESLQSLPSLPADHRPRAII